MPLLKCTKCHHEWEGHNGPCDWCGADGFVIQEKTAFETFVSRMLGGPDDEET